MADKKMVEAITSMEEDFAQWYTDVVKKAELCDYTSVKGCMVIKPAGYANLGADPEGTGCKIQSSRSTECISSHVHS